MGDNSCSELAWICCEYGFSAAVGYDAVTGMRSSPTIVFPSSPSHHHLSPRYLGIGSPLFAPLANLIANLP